MFVWVYADSGVIGWTRAVLLEFFPGAGSGTDVTGHILSEWIGSLVKVFRGLGLENTPIEHAFLHGIYMKSPSAFLFLLAPSRKRVAPFEDRFRRGLVTSRPRLRYVE